MTPREERAAEALHDWLGPTHLVGADPAVRVCRDPHHPIHAEMVQVISAVLFADLAGGIDSLTMQARLNTVEHIRRLLPGALHRAGIGCIVEDGLCKAPHLMHSKILMIALDNPDEPGYAAYVAALPEPESADPITQAHWQADRLGAR